MHLLVAIAVALGLSSCGTTSSAQRHSQNNLRSQIKPVSVENNFPLACLGPYGPGTRPNAGPRDSKRVASGQTARLCVSHSSLRPISALECQVKIEIYDQYPGYTCPLDQSCSGVGMFHNVQATQNADGTETICVDFSNTNPETEDPDFSIRY